MEEGIRNEVRGSGAWQEQVQKAKVGRAKRKPVPTSQLKVTADLVSPADSHWGRQIRPGLFPSQKTVSITQLNSSHGQKPRYRARGCPPVALRG